MRFKYLCRVALVSFCDRSSSDLELRLSGLWFPSAIESSCFPKEECVMVLSAGSAEERSDLN